MNSTKQHSELDRRPSAVRLSAAGQTELPWVGANSRTAKTRLTVVVVIVVGFLGLFAWATERGDPDGESGEMGAQVVSETAASGDLRAADSTAGVAGPIDAGAEAPATTAREFLRTYVNGTQVLEAMLAEGQDPDRVLAPLPLDQVWPQLVDLVQISDAEIEVAVQRSAEWDPSQNPAEFARRLGIGLQDFEGNFTTAELVQAGAEFHTPYVESLRAYQKGLQSAVDQLISNGELAYGPYTSKAISGLNEQSKSSIYSASGAVGGWATKLYLTRSRFPELPKLQEQSRLLRNKRDAAVRRYVQNGGVPVASRGSLSELR